MGHINQKTKDMLFRLWRKHWERPAATQYVADIAQVSPSTAFDHRPPSVKVKMSGIVGRIRK